MADRPGNATATASSGGIGVVGLTFVALLVLKLTGLAEISWLWVFLGPVLLGAALFAFAFVIIAIFLFIAFLLSR